MQGANVVILVGVLGRDTEVRTTQSGMAIANISVAIDQAWKTKDGQRHQACEWVRCVIMGQHAEFAGRYATKGRQVYIEGRIQTRKWQDKTGQDRYTTEVVAKNFQLLGKRDGPADDTDGGYNPSQPSQPPQEHGGGDYYGQGEVPF